MNRPDVKLALIGCVFIAIFTAVSWIVEATDFFNPSETTDPFQALEQDYEIR
jgi:hypothetical protein